jgi:hypothetical protein
MINSCGAISSSKVLSHLYPMRPTATHTRCETDCQEPVSAGSASANRSASPSEKPKDSGGDEGRQHRAGEETKR